MFRQIFRPIFKHNIYKGRYIWTLLGKKMGIKQSINSYKDRLRRKSFLFCIYWEKYCDLVFAYIYAIGRVFMQIFRQQIMMTHCLDYSLTEIKYSKVSEFCKRNKLYTMRPYLWTGVIWCVIHICNMYKYQYVHIFSISQ